MIGTYLELSGVRLCGAPPPPNSVQAGEMTDQRSPSQGEGPETVPGDPARTPQKACRHRSEHARSRGPEFLSMEARHLVSLTRPQGDRGREATDVGISRSHRNFDKSKSLGRPNRVSIHLDLQQLYSVATQPTVGLPGACHTSRIPCGPGALPPLVMPQNQSCPT